MRHKRTLWTGLAIAAIAVTFLAFAVAPASAQVKIRFSTWQWNETPWVKAYEAFQEEFNKNNPGIEVVRDDSRYGDKEAVFTTQSQAKAAPDIAHFSYRPIRQFADRGYILDLTPFIQKEGGDKFLAQWDPKALETCKYKGKIWCLPEDLDPMVLLYNTQHFKEAGLDPNKPPATWDQFLDYAKKLTKGERYGLGILGARQEGVFVRFNPLLWGAGGDYLTSDGKRSALDTPEALAGFKFYVELYSKHKVVPPGVIEQGAQEVRTQLAHEKVSMIISMPSEPGIVQAINPRMNVREVMALAPVPVPTGRPKVTATWFAMRVISSSAKDPEAAWKVYKAFYSKETQLRNFKIAAVLSTRLDVRSAPEVQNDKFAKIYSAQTPYVKLEPLIPEWPKIGDAVITAIQEALTGIKTPEQALKDAHIATNRALGIQ